MAKEKVKKRKGKWKIIFSPLETRGATRKQEGRNLSERKNYEHGSKTKLNMNDTQYFWSQ